MGYTLKVGNAVPVMEYNCNEYRKYLWTVESGTCVDAPTFPGDWSTGSIRSPSYSAWADFCRNVGLSHLLGDKSILLPEHPGVARIIPSDLEEVRDAIAEWKAKKWPTSERIPGWDPKTMSKPWLPAEELDPRYDGNLARLLWLEFWFDWAIKNCERPAFGNI